MTFGRRSALATWSRSKLVVESWVDVRGDLILVANLAPTATADDDVGILGELAV
jgi:hypothetical protein